MAVILVCCRERRYVKKMKNKKQITFKKKKILVDLDSFNRKHLRGKEHEINEVLTKEGLNNIKIRFPNEI